MYNPKTIYIDRLRYISPKETKATGYGQFHMNYLLTGQKKKKKLCPLYFKFKFQAYVIPLNSPLDRCLLLG